MSSARRCAAVLTGTALLGLGIDQGSKAVMVALEEGKPPVHLIGRVLTFNVSRNPGAAFSSAPTETVLFTCLAVAAIALIVIKAARLSSVGWSVALGLLLAGAAGNLCDRLARAPGFGRGAVVDFIDLQHFATFNIADSCLTCGVVLGLLLALRGVAMTAPKAPAPKAPGPGAAGPGTADPGAAGPGTAGETQPTAGKQPG